MRRLKGPVCESDDDKERSGRPSRLSGFSEVWGTEAQPRLQAAPR